MSTEAKLAGRVLTRSPLVTVLVVLILALGLGASCTIFSIIEAVLLRATPYPEADQIVRVRETEGEDRLPASPANFRDWKGQSTVFAQLVAFERIDFSVTGGPEPELVEGATVSPGFFDVFQVAPRLGRTLSGDEQAGEAVIGEGYWRRRFGGDPQVIGRSTVTVKGRSYVVVGVMPESFRFPRRSELWLPLSLSPEDWSQRGGRFLHVVGRLAPRVTLDRAQSEMDVLAKNLAREYPQSNEGMGVYMVTLQEDTVAASRPALLTLLVAVGFVLLIACANVTNLLLARGMARRREIAVQAAIGASRGQLIRHMLLESILLALLGGVAGLLLAFLGLEAILAFRPANLRALDDASINSGVMTFGLVLSLVTGLIAGLAPALQAGRVSLTECLNEAGAKGTAGLRSRRVQSAFVVVQVAVALVLLIAAGLMIRSFQRLLAVDPGFDQRHVFTMRLTLPEDPAYAEAERQKLFFRQVLERVQHTPGVQDVAAVAALPLTSYSQEYSFTILGRPAPRSDDEPSAAYNAISPRYFPVLAIPLLEGRLFTPRDDSGAPPVAIINRSLARRYWPDANPIGQLVEIGDGGANPVEIVGVVGDVRGAGLDTDAKPEIYVPFEQRPSSYMTIVARTPAAPETLAAPLRQAVWSVDKNLSIAKAATLEEVLSDSVAQRRFTMLLLTLFAGIALILAAVGVYGVLSYLVGQRTQEIGIRLALGAEPGDVRRLVLRQGVGLVLAGIGIGLPAALLLTRLATKLLYGISSADPATYAGVSLVLFLTALLASYLPAIRALRVDPLIAIKGT